MLPTAGEFDEMAMGQDGVLSRLHRLEGIDGQLQELLQRCQRARALSVLELFEETRSYGECVLALGLSRGRVAQLVRDGRDWREWDRRQELQDAARI